MQKISRRAFGSQITKAAVLAGAFFDVSANAQIVWTPEEWKVSTFNQLLSENGVVKQLFDITSPATSLDKVKNSLNGLQIGFGIPSTEIRMVAGLHGPANLLNFDDYIWNKYKIGAWLNIQDPETGRPALRNPFYASPFRAAPLGGNPDDLQSPWHDISMEGLQRRGVHFLGCHTALEFQVLELVKQESFSAAPETIVHEMLEHLQPGSLMVVAMVAAMAMLQGKGQYSYLKV
jgi:hypothetical protein